MEKLVIRGGRPLNGSVVISGMKNAALGIIFGCLLVKDRITLEDLPRISDVNLSLDILRSMGAEVTENADGSVTVDCTNAVGGISPDELVKKMRASYYLLGAELGRFGRARVGRSGGCDFGKRPIDQHIKGFEALGGVVTVSDDCIRIEAENGIRGNELFFDVITVGGTINMLLAAVLAEGTTIIENAAKEPHIVDVANFLNTCGAVISGAGTDTIKIKGVRALHGCTYAIVPDMIEAGTYMIAAAATRGCLRIENVIPKHLESITAKLLEMGVSVDEFDDAIVVSAPDPLNHINLKTLPYPGYPTDMQPQICALLSISEGTSHLIEGVIENRFRYVEELRRLGASIEVNGKTATINGVEQLHGARVRAVDLRAGAAMVIAGLASDGVTEIEDIHHIERGYDDIVGKLKKVGADIEKVVIESL